jgi:hypothetical protein
VVEPLNVVVPLTARVLFKVVAPVTPSAPPSVVVPVPTVNGFAPETVVAPFKVILPVPVENVPVPDCAKLPEEFKLVNDPVEAVVPPIGVPLIEPPVIVAPDEAKVFAVVAPFRETVPVPVENVPLPDWIIFPVAVRLVNFPVEGVAAPMAIPSIEPPVRVTPEEANVFAVVEPFRETVPVPVENVPVPDWVKLPDAVSPVNMPDEAVLDPIDVPLIEPPEIVTPDEAKLFAVVAPLKVFAPTPVWV